ncbi:hypothetical protein F4778DRAFT_90677 [Xylariomycetidae sp. FL2044]|nr:hypothetical protein F4778DRAFT_90677 [Xylariomycetidae sp. FL2044]
MARLPSAFSRTSCGTLLRSNCPCRTATEASSCPFGPREGGQGPRTSWKLDEARRRVLARRSRAIGTTHLRLGLGPNPSIWVHFRLGCSYMRTLLSPCSGSSESSCRVSTCIVQPQIITGIFNRPSNIITYTPSRGWYSVLRAGRRSPLSLFVLIPFLVSLVDKKGMRTNKTSTVLSISQTSTICMRCIANSFPSPDTQSLSLPSTNYVQLPRNQCLPASEIPPLGRICRGRRVWRTHLSVAKIRLPALCTSLEAHSRASVGANI